jgi:hypothetical protein
MKTHSWKARHLLASLACLVTAAVSAQSTPPPSSPPHTLEPASHFSSIKDPTERSTALFIEASKVITHPRCLNCHPAVRSPTQGDNGQPHVPPINAGESGIGQPGLTCMGCHQAENVKVSGTKFRSIPGHVPWMLAPKSMAWQGLSLHELCEQVKDPARNGNKSMAELHHHMAEDGLVGWAWHPGEGRVPAPGTQKVFGELIQAWMDTGAHCPK